MSKNYTLRQITSEATENGFMPGTLPIHYDLVALGYERMQFSENRKREGKEVQIPVWKTSNYLNKLKKTNQKSGKRADVLFTFTPKAINYGVTQLYLPALNNIILSTNPGMQIGFAKESDALGLVEAFTEHYNAIRTHNATPSYRQTLLEYLGESERVEAMEEKIKIHLASLKEPSSKQLTKNLELIKRLNPSLYKEMTVMINDYLRSID